jgi:type I restriction enzyme M protein
VPKYAYLATPEELKENDYNLNIPLYVDTFEEEESVDLAVLKVEIAKIEEQLATTRTQLAKALQELGV